MDKKTSTRRQRSRAIRTAKSGRAHHLEQLHLRSCNIIFPTVMATNTPVTLRAPFKTGSQRTIQRFCSTQVCHDTVIRRGATLFEYWNKVIVNILAVIAAKTVRQDKIMSSDNLDIVYRSFSDVLNRNNRIILVCCRNSSQQLFIARNLAFRAF